MDVLETIKSRRSVREFTGETVDEKSIEKILEAGRWAPSGLNNQPWRFRVVKDKDTKSRVAACTHYGSVIENAPVCIVVFLDSNECYDRTKDVQAVGACIQNMLLETHSLGLGAVWLGEILNKRERVEEILNMSSSHELMAVIALGHPKSRKRESGRKKLSELLG